MGETESGRMADELTFCDVPWSATERVTDPSRLNIPTPGLPLPHSPALPYSRSPILPFPDSPISQRPQNALLLTRDIEKLLCYYACEYGK